MLYRVGAANEPRVIANLFANAASLKGGADNSKRLQMFNLDTVPPNPLLSKDAKVGADAPSTPSKKADAKGDGADGDSKRHKPKEAAVVKVDFEPTVQQIRQFRTMIRRNVVAASAMPRETLIWIMEVEHAESWTELADCPAHFDGLDCKLNVGLHKFIKGELKRKLNVLEEQLIKEKGYMLVGRQTLWFIYDDLKLHSGDGASMEIKDLFNVHLNGDNLQKFIHDWSYTLMDMKSQPDDIQLECLLRDQLRKSEIQSV